jgi:LysM repeat protein
MNNQSPLIPLGSNLEQKNRGRARVKIAVFFVLAVHGIGLMALLMQGCGQPKDSNTSSENTPSNVPPAFVPETNPPVTTSNPPAVVTPPAAVETPIPPAPPAGATEYTIAKGDTFSTIATKFHVTTKAIGDANPGVDSKKLQIGQKIHIPAPTSTPAPTAASGTGTASLETPAATGEQTYTVKSGDNLTKIASQFGVSVKALRAANSLKTDSIKVGQKLKIPAKASTAAPVVPPTEPATTTPATPTGR